MNLKKNLVKSSISRYLEVVVSAITAIILTPYLIEQLGEVNYGLWVLILSTLGWFGFIDLGFSAAIQRQMTILIETNEPAAFNRFFSCAFALFFILSTIATLGIFLLGVYPQILGVPEEKLHTTSIIILILCLKVFMDFLMNAFHGIFVGHVRFDIDANIGIAMALTKAIIVFFVVKDFGLYGVVWATVSVEVLNNIIKIAFARHIQKELTFSLSSIDFEEIKKLFSFSKHIFLMIIAQTIKDKTNPAIIAHYLDLSSITLFSIANRLAVMIEQLVSAIVYVFGPVFYKQVANNTKQAQVQSSLYIIVSLYGFFSAIFFIPIAVMSESIIELWIGIKFPNIQVIVSLLVFALLERATGNPISALLVAKAQHKKIALMSLFIAIVSVLASIFLVSIYGLIGIAIAAATGSLISMIGCSILLKVETSISPQPVFRSYLILTLLFISMSLYGDFLLIHFDKLTWLNLLTNLTIIFVITLLLSWFSLLNTNSRSILVGQIVALTKKN